MANKIIQIPSYGSQNGVSAETQFEVYRDISLFSEIRRVPLRTPGYGGPDTVGTVQVYQKYNNSGVECKTQHLSNLFYLPSKTTDVVIPDEWDYPTEDYTTDTATISKNQLFLVRKTYTTSTKKWTIEGVSLKYGDYITLNPDLSVDSKAVNEITADDIAVIDGKNFTMTSKIFAAKDVNVKAVFNSIHNIFHWIPGERILNPEFGSKLRTYLYEGITDMNIERIVAEVKGVCLKWEPRVHIDNVVPSQDVNYTEDNTVRLDIIFSIPSLSTKQYQYSYIYDRTR